MGLPIVEYFYTNGQDYHIKVTVDSTLRSDSENPVESDAIQAAIDSGAIIDLSKKQYKQLTIPVVVGGAQKDTVEGAIQGLAALRASVPSSGSAKLMTAEAAYTDKVSAPVDSDTRNLTTQNLAAFFMNSPTPESWLGKVLGTKLGKSWLPTSMEHGSRTICFANGLWNTGRAWSTDGKNWTQSTGLISEPYCIAYANNIWVLGTGGGPYWSTDGKSWTRGTQPGSSSSTVVNYVDKVCYANGLWVAVGETRGILWSTDGKSWTLGTGYPVGGNALTFVDVVFANGLWVAINYSRSGSRSSWWSSDGKFWTTGTGSVSSGGALCYADGVWSNGRNWSTDGKTWQTGSGLNDISERVWSIYHANGLWVAGTSYEGMFWSTDGKNWTQGNVTSSGYIHSIYFANGMWIATDYVNGCWWSTDGKNWTQGTMQVPVLHAQAAAYRNGIWAMTGYFNTTGICYSDVKDLL